MSIVVIMLLLQRSRQKSRKNRRKVAPSNPSSAGQGIVQGTISCPRYKAGLEGLLMIRNLLWTAVVLTMCASFKPALAQSDEKRMFALNMYHEARGQGRDGMIAVGWVVLNRVADGSFPSDALAVITHKRGRSCEWRWWCDGKSDDPKEAGPWQEAQAIAEEMLGDNPPDDPTNGALWFQESFRDRPKWMGDEIELKAEYKGHHFYGLR